MCVSVSDVDTPVKIRMGYNEENAEVICEVEFFALQTNKKSEYNATVRFDFRNIKYNKTDYHIFLTCRINYCFSCIIIWNSFVNRL